MIYTLEDYKNDVSRNERLTTINSFEDLYNKWFYKNFQGQFVLERRKIKMEKPYQNILGLMGHGLELGFAWGTSTYVLLTKYSNITLDLLDFLECYEKIGNIFKNYYATRIKDIFICNSRNIPVRDNVYDFINSQSFFEHLTEEDYWSTLRECKRTLKQDGHFFVYVDQTVGKDNPEHVRVKPFNEIRAEIESVGFEALSDFHFINRKS